MRPLPSARALGKGRIARMAGAPAALLLQLTQRFHQRVIGMHRRRERRIALVLQAREPPEIQVVRPAGGLLQRAAPHNDERCARHAMQALVGRGRHRGNAAAEIDRLGAEAAHAIHQQAHVPRAAQCVQCLQVVQAPGGGFMMNHCHVRDRAVRVERGGNALEVGCLHPVVRDHLVGNAVLRGDLRNALAVHAVLHDQQLALLGHQRGDHALHRRRAGAGHQDRGPLGRIQFVDIQQACARFVLQVEELAFAVAQVGLQQALADPFRQGNGARIE